MAKYFALLNVTACILAGTIAEPALAQSSQVQAGSTDSDADLRRQLDEVLAREAKSKARIEQLEQRLQALESAVLPEGSKRLSESQEQAMRGRGAATGYTTQTLPDGSVAIIAGAGAAAAATEGTAEPGQSTAEPEEGTAEPGQEADRKTPATPESVQIVQERQQNIYRDKFSLELGLTYTHFDNAALDLSGFLALDSIFLGKISLDQITSDVLIADGTFRFGVTDRLQFDVDVPYFYRTSTFTSGGAGGDASGLKESTVTQHAIGDVNFGVSYRLFRETLRRPDIVLNARVKAPTGVNPWGIPLVEVPGSEGNLKVPERLPTGTGVWSAQFGVSVLKTIDPMVVFGSFTYFRNFRKHFKDVDEADFNQPGDVEIGDAFQYGAGVAYALNDRSSLSMSFTQRIVEHTALFRDCAGCGKDTIVSSQANVGIFNLGANFSLTQRLAFLATFGIGVTQDAPKMSFGIRIPYRF